jgi:hypothetical protein
MWSKSEPAGLELAPHRHTIRPLLAEDPEHRGGEGGVVLPPSQGQLLMTTVEDSCMPLPPALPLLYPAPIRRIQGSIDKAELISR